MYPILFGTSYLQSTLLSGTSKRVNWLYFLPLCTTSPPGQGIRTELKGNEKFQTSPKPSPSKGTAIAAHISLERGWLVILELWVVFLPLLLFRNEGLSPSWHRVGLFDVAFLRKFAHMKEENHIEVGKPGQMLAIPRSGCQCPASSLQSGAASLFPSLSVSTCNTTYVWH